jgi:hypothetical protein
MNREDIIRLAREAGEAEGMAEFVFHPVIERFASLVVSAEREACAKMLEAASKTGKIISCTSAAKAIRERGQS